MPRLTNEHLHSEIKLVKQEVEYIKDNQERMQADLTMIKKTLLGPDDGTIARVNKNTDFRNTTRKVIWSIWVALIGIIGKIIFWD
tara:strand:+ start:2766 stop:3020 length:255 start_codon:yes stop_codon:yes gene_type:complete